MKLKLTKKMKALKKEIEQTEANLKAYENESNRQKEISDRQFDTIFKIGQTLKYFYLNFPLNR